MVVTVARAVINITVASLALVGPLLPTLGHPILKRAKIKLSKSQRRSLNAVR